MKDLYDAARHLVWLTQFGLSVVLPPVLFLLGAVWLRKQFGLGGWVILVGFALGMVAAIGSLRSSLKAIERQGRAPEKKQGPPPPPLGGGLPSKPAARHSRESSLRALCFRTHPATGQAQRSARTRD